MTSENRLFIDLSDIAGIEFECRECGAKILYPLVKHYDRLSERCPNCQMDWFQVTNHAVTKPIADDVKMIFTLIQKVTKSSAVLAQVRFQVIPPSTQP